MDILIIMCIGMLIGRCKLLRRMKKKNEYLSLACTFILIFSMGVTLGLTSLLFCLIPMAFSILFVYVLTQRFMKKEKESEATPEAGEEKA